MLSGTCPTNPSFWEATEASIQAVTASLQVASKLSGPYPRNPKVPSAPMKRILIVAVSWLCFNAPSSRGSQPEPAVIDAIECGAVGDGVHDDGPAVTTMLKKAAEVHGSTLLRFAPHRSYFVKTASTRYVFPFQDAADITIDGGGSVFLVDGNLRFVHLHHCRNIVVTNLSVDYVPLPFADGNVIAKDPQAGCIDVEVLPGFALPPLGGPTRQDGEQTYFGMLWHHEDDRLLSLHYEITDLEEAYPGSLGKRVVRAFASPRFRGFAAIVPGQWQISLPVRGVAHRYGPGPTIDIAQCKNVSFQDVEVWSAPWFAVQALGNEGALTFRRTHIRPREGRLTSAWRDGFHVKGNAGKLLWEDCEVTGTNDDAFNISTHASRVLHVASLSQATVHQAYAGGYIPWRVGDTFVAADLPSGRLLGKAKIEAINEATPAEPGGTPPTVTVTLATPLENLATGSLVWDAETSNPDVLLSRCQISNSCRMQSAVRLEDCAVRGLLWFYADPLEGPIPATVMLRNCDLRRGRGNPSLALSVDGHSATGAAQGARREDAAALPFALGELQVKGCRIEGDMAVTHVEDVQMWNNHFGAHDHLSVQSSTRASLKDNGFPPGQVNAGQDIDGK